MLLPDTNAAEGGTTLGRLRDVVGAALRRATSDVLPATVELAASAAPEHGATAGALLAAADATLRRGRGGMLPIIGRALQTAA